MMGDAKFTDYKTGKILSEEDIKRITYRSADGNLCINDFDTGNVLSIHDLQCMMKSREKKVFDLVYQLMERLERYEDAYSMEAVRKRVSAATKCVSKRDREILLAASEREALLSLSISPHQ